MSRQDSIEQVTPWAGTGSFYPRAPSHPTLSYIILPPLTTSNHILPCHTFLPHIQPCPTLPYHSPPRSRRDSSALLPCPTSSYPILPHPTPAYTVSYCRPNLVLNWILLRSYPDSTQQPSPRLAPLAGLLH